jgi:hypothetical protein
MTIARGELFSGALLAAAAALTSASGIFFSVNLVPVRMNFGSSDAGACGAMIFW